MLLTPDRWANPALIDHLTRVRKPWNTLTERIVRTVLTKWLPQSPISIVEIGAGGGQLREWLPCEHAANTTHTEPSEPFLETLRRQHPGANVIRADATALPFSSSSVGAILALCVFDTLRDLTSVRDELKRVLTPGGVVVHFLDLSTSPDCLFPELIAGGELPLTNFMADPALVDVLSAKQKSLLPRVDEFDDVLAVKWDAFRSFVGMLAGAHQPIVAELGPYANLHRPGQLDPDQLANGFMAVSADPARLFALNKALLRLTLSAHQMGRDWPLRAISSRAHIRSRLQSAFESIHGFEVDFAGPISAREVLARDATLSPDTRFVLRHAGRTVKRGERVLKEYGTSVEMLRGAPVADRVANADQVIRETTVEVFVTRRVKTP